MINIRHPEPESIRLLNRMNHAEIAADLEYIKMVSGIRYGWKIVGIIRLKPKIRQK